MKNFLQKVNPYKNKLLDFWWHRLCVAIIGIIILVALIGAGAFVVERADTFLEKTYILSFENEYLNTEGKQKECIADNYWVTCGKLNVISGDVVTRFIRDHGDEINSKGVLIKTAILDSIFKGYSNQDLAKSIIDLKDVHAKIQTKVLVVPLIITILIALSIVLGAFLIFSGIYRLVLFVISGRKYFN